MLPTSCTDCVSFHVYLAKRQTLNVHKDSGRPTMVLTRVEIVGILRIFSWTFDCSFSRVNDDHQMVKMTKSPQ